MRQLDKSFRKYLAVTNYRQIANLVLDAHYERLHESEIDLLIQLLTQIKNNQSSADELIRQVEDHYFDKFIRLNYYEM